MNSDKPARRGVTLPQPPLWRDFAVIAVAALALLLLMLMGDLLAPLHPIRIVVGIGYMLLAPGYCFVAALFPRRDDLDAAERFGLSLGVGLALIVVLALVLDRFGLGFGQWRVVLAAIVLTTALSWVAMWRRVQLREPGHAVSPLAAWRSLPNAERRLYAILAAGGLAIVGFGALSLLVPSGDQYLTEFYVLGADGNAERYPYQTRPNQPVSVTLVIVNRERAETSYAVEAWTSDMIDPSGARKLSTLSDIRLDPGDESVHQLSWTMPSIGDDQQVEILLFRDGHTETYRRLRLWMNVRG